MERPKKIKAKATKKQSRILSLLRAGFPIIVTLGGVRPVYGIGEDSISRRTFDSMRHKGMIQPKDDALIRGMPSQTWGIVG